MKQNRFRPKPHLCLICDGSTTEVICKKCRVRVHAAFGERDTLVFCRRCDRFEVPTRLKHGLAVSELRPKQVNERVLIVYEENGGCPDCPQEDATVRPHHVITRLQRAG